MRINTDIDLRNRSKVTLSDFKGLDTLSTEVEVSAIHASNMKNLISRDGINHKRYGWSTQYRLRNNSAFPAIKGIFNFTIFAIQFLVVYSDKRFWLVNRSTSEFINITNKRIDANGLATNNNTSISQVDVNKLIDSECKLFLNGDKAYFVGCGDLLVFSKWENGYFELRRVVGNEDVYIPTTTENIGCEEDGNNYTRITSEEINLLSPYIKNTLFGRADMSYTNENAFDTATYYLDKQDFFDVEVEVERNNGQKIVLTRSSGNGYYSLNDIIANTMFNSFSHTYSETFSGTIKETKSYKNRWLTWEDAAAAGYANIAGASYSEKARVVNWTNPYTGNKYQNYQEYLDAMFRKYMGYEPSTASVVTARSCEITCSPNIEVEIASFGNGGRLIYQISVSSYANITPYGSVDGVSLSYKQPYSIGCSLVYVLGNNRTTIKTFSNVNFSFSISSVTSSSITASITFYLPGESVNLSSYSATLSSIHNGVHFVDYNSYMISYSENNSVVCTGSVSTAQGRITLNAVSGDASFYAPLVDGKPNITAKIQIGQNEENIVGAMLGIKFGTQGTTDRLFIVAPNGNTIYWSKDEDFTYFGDKSWCVCGTADKKITGMDRLNDTTLLIVKEFSAQEPSVYVISGAIYTGKTEANTVDYTAVFTPSGFQVGMGAVGSITNFNGDCLMVAKDGVYAVSLGENMTVDSRYILHRSKQISNLLERYDLSASKCIAFNGKYYIYVGGEQHECFVADNKYKTLFNHDESQVNYEWWRWEHIPVSVWGFVDDELWFGTQDGQLCKFTNKFYDEEKSMLQGGLIGYNVSSNKITEFAMNNSIDFKTGDIFQLDCDLYQEYTTNKFYIEGGKTHFELPLAKFTNGEEIKISVNGIFNNYAIQFDENGLTFSINYVTQDNTITFYKDVNNSQFKVIRTGARFTLKDENDEAVVFSQPLSASISDFKAYMIHKEVVVAEWWTGALDLGNRAYQKTLTYFVLTGEKNLANHLKYGFKTRFNHTDFELLRANNDLEMEETDIQTVSLDSEFGSSFTKRLNIRNVNFVMLYFRVETEEDLAINSVQIEFKLIKRNIGVR